MKLTFTIADDSENYIGVVHKNTYIPIEYRTVQIELTADQLDKFKLKHTGNSNGWDLYESIISVHIESDTVLKAIKIKSEKKEFYNE